MGLNAGISRLYLCSFRNYLQIQIVLWAPIIIIVGDNGAGKTNILEAISLLSPGKGLRSAKLSQITTFASGSTPCWTVAAHLKDDHLETILGTGLEYTSGGLEKRRVKINGLAVRTQGEFLQYLNIAWIVPGMDRLFQESSNQRRKFVDRMVYAFDPDHADRLHRYEHYLRERSMLLREGRGDPQWLSSIEKNLAGDGIAISLARAEVIRALLNHQPQDSQSPFPRFFAQMQGELEKWCKNLPAIEVEAKLAQAFANNRQQDSYTGGSAVGPQRSDLHVKNLAKLMPAEFCSAGEQKMLLIALTLAFIKLQISQSNCVTLLLLDDVIAQLDFHHRQYLFQELCQMLEKGAKLQIWMTGTCAADFIYLKKVCPVR